jgi:L-ascorbate metabolism protein UlaG (beta-lactamase superfamily)
MVRIEATLIGGPTLRLRYGGIVFLTDPTFDPPGRYEAPRPLTKLSGPVMTVEEIGPVDAVLLSHDQHADNLDHAGRAFLDRASRVFSTPTAASRIPRVTGLAPWQQADVGPVAVTAVPALHGPEGAEESAGPVTGFLLTGPGLPRVYVSGDNASVELVRGVAERMGAVDVAVLFVGAANVGRFGPEPMTLTGDRAVEVARILSAGTVVPVHADGWAHLTETMDDVRAAFARNGELDRLRILEPGVPVGL